MAHSTSVTVRVAHALGEAWQDVTVGARLTRWFATTDGLRAGGDFRFDFDDGDYFTGRVTRWEEPRLVELEWRFWGLGPRFHIRYALAPADGGTDVTVHDHGSRSAADADSLHEGWTDFLERLARFARTGERARYEWSQSIGGGAFATAAPAALAATLTAADAWDLPGCDFTVAPDAAHPGPVEGRGPSAVTAARFELTFRDPRWQDARTRALVKLEAEPAVPGDAGPRPGSYVSVSHDGFTALPEALQRDERRRFAGLWARALGRLERGSRALMVTLACGLATFAASQHEARAAQPQAACQPAPPPLEVSDPERDLAEIESLAVAIKKTTKAGICHALLGFDREAVRGLVTADARIQALSPTAESPVVSGPRARGAVVKPLAPACYRGREQLLADLDRIMAGWLRVERCAFDPVVIHATRAAAGSPRRARAELHLWLGGVTASGARHSDKGDVDAELVEDQAGRWRLTRLDWRERERFWASGPAFSDWTDRAGLPRDWPDEGYRHDLILGQILYGGIAAGDYDGDGWPDLYLSRAGGGRLLRNDGKGGFVDVTAAAGLEAPGNGQAALFVDLDNDGDQDLVVINATYSLVTGAHARVPSAVYRNDGGRFTRMGSLGPLGPASGVSAADYDGDGRLDLFVTYYQDEALHPYHHRIEARDGFGDHLFRNRGDFVFEDVTARAGVGGSGWSYASSWADYDEDGRIDLYVANDFGDNYLYRNRGDGRFEEVAARAHALDPANGMSVDWGDYDNDGHLDLYLSNMYSKTGNQYLAVYPDLDATLRRKLAFAVTGNTMYRNRGDGRFEEVARRLGTNVAGWAWGANFLDYDNDGWLDLHVANGFWAGDSPEDA